MPCCYYVIINSRINILTFWLKVKKLMDRWMDGWTDRQTNGHADRWMDGWMDMRAEMKIIIKFALCFKTKHSEYLRNKENINFVYDLCFLYISECSTFLLYQLNTLYFLSFSLITITKFEKKISRSHANYVTNRDVQNQSKSRTLL